ncbi:MAG: GNAT family N-acetyltransferase [Deinococcota bacterium]
MSNSPVTSKTQVSKLLSKPSLNQVDIVTIRPEFAEDLEVLQVRCFPTLAASELMRKEHFLNHCKVFSEGNFVALVQGRVVGLGAGFLIDFDFDDPNHSFLDIIDGGYFGNHDPNGDYYYGADISVDPDYRKQGIGRLLYEARQGLVRRLNRKGIVAGGVLPGFANYKHLMSAGAYVQDVVAKRIYDRTLSFQLKNGFKVKGVLQDYIEDSASDNWASLIVWENPDYRP